MTACIICMTDAFRGLPMHDKDQLTHAAHELLQGLISGMTSILGNKDSFKSFKPPRLGTCIVERCAQTLEVVCKGCRGPSCQRCLLAAELRAAEDRINDERDAELSELFDNQTIEVMVDNMAKNLCENHVLFGPVLIGQCYSRRNFMTPMTSNAS